MRLFRTIVCQRIGNALQLRSVCLCDCTGRRVDLVYLGNDARRGKSCQDEDRLYCCYRIGRCSVHRKRLCTGCDPDGCTDGLPVHEQKGKYQIAEYGSGMPDGDRSRLFFLCIDHDPCYSRYSYEPECTE